MDMGDDTMAMAVDGAAAEGYYGAAPDADAAPAEGAPGEDAVEDGPMLALEVGGGARTYQVRVGAALLCGTVKMIVCTDVSGDEPADLEPEDVEDMVVPLPSVDPPTMDLVVRWLDHRYDHPHSTEEERDQYNEEFLTALEDDPLFDLITAANYLEVKELLDASCQRVADIIKACDTPQDIRRRFNITNDFTPEEEEAVTIPPSFDLT